MRSSDRVAEDGTLRPPVQQPAQPTVQTTGPPVSALGYIVSLLGVSQSARALRALLRNDEEAASSFIEGMTDAELVALTGACTTLLAILTGHRANRHVRKFLLLLPPEEAGEVSNAGEDGGQAAPTQSAEPA